MASILSSLSISVGLNNKAASIFESLYNDFRELPYTSPNEYVSTYWEKYLPTEDRNLNGKIFEYILATLFIREGILPFYLSAKVTFVPNVIYDLMVYTVERGPICISAKTSLRERYKQADLEAYALKQVHRRALSYLVTLEEREADMVRKKIMAGDVAGLDKVVVATSAEFNALIAEIKQYKALVPPKVEVVESNQIIGREKLELWPNNF